MKKRLDHIYNEPPRVFVILGINLEAFQCLTAQVEKAHWGIKNPAASGRGMKQPLFEFFRRPKGRGIYP